MEMERVTLILTSMFMAIKFITKDSKVCASWLVNSVSEPTFYQAIDSHKMRRAPGKSNAIHMYIWIVDETINILIQINYRNFWFSDLRLKLVRKVFSVKQLLRVLRRIYDQIYDQDLCSVLTARKIRTI